ncbi:MAG: Blue-light-activated protein [Gemmatimonadetes bacterium]|nr:Blue-light-activated protein [Gemmatimonadota bacterium]
MQGSDDTVLAPPRRSSGLRRWFYRTGLSVRLGVLSGALAALVTAGTFAALNVEVRRSARRLISEELAHNGRTLVSLQRDNRRQLVLTASLLAESPIVLSAISTYRGEQQTGNAQRADLTNTVEGALARVGEGLRGGALLTTDENGRVIAAYRRNADSSLRGLDLSSLPAVHHALDASLVTISDEPYLAGLEVGSMFYGVGVAPLINDGFTIGTIIVGERVDSSLVASLRRAFEGDVVISAGPRIISSTLPAALSQTVATSRDTTGSSLTLGGEEYLVAVIPIGQTQRGTPLKITLLQPLSPSVNGLTAALRRDFLLYGSLAVLLAALGAGFVSRSVLRPLSRFIRFMRVGAERERVDHAFDAEDASREIRALNESFDQLMAALGGKRTELERRGAELAASNEVLTDEIQQRERIEKALRESEAQLRQSQKLEAVGTLAGGIAHDFNNMLTVISGFTQIAIATLGKEHPVSEDLRHVSDASRSAAALTHQLLAFSRKQMMQLRVLDLEGVVEGMESMLRRLIGTHIKLEVVHVGEPVRLKADPGQLEQVLLNLAVNARDAMPGGGTLTITTTHRPNVSGPPGAVLRVTDTGCGMPADVRDRIFEPFFTTKDVGKGTGLGLSTVYGIVIQSGGAIEVESEVGVGTTFTVVFPAVIEMPLAAQETDENEEHPRGTETILLVDDEEAVLDFARRTLDACGYRVIAARSGVEALTQSRTEQHIDVLLTDVLMPQLSGPQLVERYLAKYSPPVIIYMTGFVDDATMRLELDEDVVLLRKPFSALELARTVRSALDVHRAAFPTADVS